MSINLKQPKYVSALADGIGAGGASSKRVRSPMPGVINRVLAKAGDKVQKGDSLMVLIAMKMEYVIRAPQDGTIKALPFAAGQTVQKDAELVVFEEEKASDE